MAKLTSLYFSTADIAAIEQAVKAAESKTSGELAIQIVDRSHNWQRERLFAGALFGLIGSAISLVVTMTNHWGISFDMTASSLWGIIGFGFGYGVVGHLWLWRKNRRRRLVFDAAKQFFFTLPKTSASTAVLIYVSLQEANAEIIVDTAIARQVEPNFWEAVDLKLTAAMVAGNHAEGLIAAVAEIGSTMSLHFPRSADDANELTDRPGLG